MIGTLVGFKKHNFIDAKTNKEVVYVELLLLIDREEHGDNNYIGHKHLYFNTTKNTVESLVVGSPYEIVMSAPRLDKKGQYITKPSYIREL